MARLGTGIRKDPRTGRFVARLVDAYGKRRSKTFEKEKDATRWLNVKRAERDAIKEGRAAPVAPLPERPRVLFRDYLDDWHSRINVEIAHSTRIRYEQHLGDIKAGPLGDIPIDELSFRDVEAWLAELKDARDDDGDPRFGYYHVKGMMDILRRATRRMQLEYSFPLWACETVEIPKAVRKRKGKRGAFTPAELGAFLKALDGEWFRGKAWRGLFWTIAATGARPAEVLALRYSDLDFKAGEITICRTAYEGVIKEETKTGEPRYPALPPELAAVLKEHRQRFPGVADALVFPPLERAGRTSEARWESSLQGPFKRALKAAKITRKGLTPYSLRNAFNSIADASGVNPLALRDTLGHVDRAMTERYKRTRADERAQVTRAVLDAALAAE